MDKAEKLELLKLDLQRTGAVLDKLLVHYLDTAAERIARMGITLNDTPGDDGLQISYAAYLYRCRANPEMQMPESLRWELTNRLLSEKGQVGE